MDLKKTQTNFDKLLLKEKNLTKDSLFLQTDINNVNKIHKKMTENYKYKNKIIGLDTLQFQKILLINEKNSFDNCYNLIINRIYADYYNILKSISKFINESKTIKDKKNKSTFDKKYNYLDIKKKYTSDEINTVFSNILINLNLIKTNIEYEKTNLETGIPDKTLYNIDNFISSCNSDININNIKIKLYSNYLEYYISLHNNYLDILEKKLKLLFSNSLVNKELIQNGDNQNISKEMGILNENDTNFKLNIKKIKKSETLLENLQDEIITSIKN